MDYLLLVRAVLPEHSRAHLEKLMAIPEAGYVTEFSRRLIAEGEARGRDEGRVQERAALVLRILARSGVNVSDPARARITRCTDLDQLGRWLDRAMSVSTIDELFAGD